MLKVEKVFKIIISVWKFIYVNNAAVLNLTIGFNWNTDFEDVHLIKNIENNNSRKDGWVA